MMILIYNVDEICIGWVHYSGPILGEKKCESCKRMITAVVSTRNVYFMPVDVSCYLGIYLLNCDSVKLITWVL